MRLKTSLWYGSLVLVLVILVASGPVSAADSWIMVDPQDQVIAWEQLNANTNMAKPFPYASSGSGFTMPSLSVWKNISGTQPVPAAPGAPVQPAPTTGNTVIGDKTIGGTPVSDLFRNAMANYFINPPKTPVIPGGNKPIYSSQIPIIWS
jgi:hypothetical protein